MRLSDKKILCPKHHVPMARKRILYGYPDPSMDYKGYILGGCCVSDDSPQHGFECPVDHKAYVVNNQGVPEPLFDFDDEDEAEDAHS